jgi:predicted PurR-regulated permease PerM
MVVAAHFAGFWGLLLIAPVTATTVQIYKYAKRAAKLEDGNEPE